MLVPAKRERRKAEKKWLKTGLTIFKQLYDKAKKKVASIIQRARKSYFISKIESCHNAKQLYNIRGTLSGTEKTSPLPTTYAKEDLPQVFNSFFQEKNSTIRLQLDSDTSQHTHPPPTSCYSTF